MDFARIERKWRKRWEKAKIFEANPSRKPKFFLTAAYPYVQAPQHIGHARVYSTADVYARFKRMQGYNVLFPMAWHITGTPILAIAKRIAGGDPEMMDTYLRIFHVKKEDLEKFKDPKKIVDYFIEEIRNGMKEIGFSIDWRRQFTTGDPAYNKFICWQFRKLKGKGLIKKGTHPVGYCPNCQNPVGEHDTLHDKRAEIEELTLIKFELDGKFLPAGTLRPETIFGTTNFWVNPNASYVEVEVGSEHWIISKQCAQKIGHQKAEIRVIKGIEGKELVGKKVKVPLVGRKVLILPASFVDPDNITGLVYSVPAHAPYDWIALKEIQEKPEKLRRYGISPSEIRKIKPISLIALPGYGKFPAIEICEKFGIREQKDERLEEVTKEIYSKENSFGVMKITGKYKGMPVKQAKEEVKLELFKTNLGDVFYEIMNKPLICRCGTTCIVKMIRDQWFIDYGNPIWKRKSHRWFKEMRIIPEVTRADYHYTIDWLHERACARRAGFGTRLPFDPRWMIESLSDSTIYMAFYTIAHHLARINAELLDDSFFDYVFLGKGSAEKVARKCNLSKGLLKRLRREFEYWYPLDSRHSAKDLIPNHLTFFVMNHLAIFPRKHWPKQIVTNGFVLMEGEKMSKSLGNIVPLREGIKKFGADMIRTSVLSTSTMEQDANFTLTLVSALKGKLRMLYQLVKKIERRLRRDHIGRWLQSVVNRHIREATLAMERLSTREAVNHSLFLFSNDVAWYLRRSGGGIPREVIESWIRLLSPFMPYNCEELWERIGCKGFVSLAPWPKAREKLIRDEIELAEEIVKQTLQDVLQITKLLKKKPKEVRIFIAERWKYKLVREAISYFKKKKEIWSMTRKLMLIPEIRRNADQAMKIIQKFLKDPGKIPEKIIDRKIELAALRDARKFYEKELGCKILIELAERSKEAKAKQAMPGKPGILIDNG